MSDHGGMPAGSHETLAFIAAPLPAMARNMELRDWLAGQALVAVIARHDRESIDQVRRGIRAGREEARTAVNYADALLAELEKPRQ